MKTLPPDVHRRRYVLEHLDAISREICSVIDSAEFTRNAHQQREYRDAANGAFHTISKLIHGLNADTTLYDKLVEVAGTTTTAATATTIPPTATGPRSLGAETEDRLFSTDLKREFETDGVHLPRELKVTLARLQERVVEAETGYTHNIQEADATLFAVHLPNCEAYLRDSIRQWLLHNNIPQEPLQQEQEQGQGQGPEESLYMNAAAARVLVSSIQDAETRERIWHGMRGANKANIAGLGALVKARHELATLLGFESYAHKYLSNKIFRTPEEVLAFLQSVAGRIQPQAASEYKALVAAMDAANDAMQGGESSNNSSSSVSSSCGSGGRDFTAPPVAPQGSPLALWDMAYANMHAASEEDSSTGANTATITREVSQYFPIDAVLQGLQTLSADLFGLEVQLRAADQLPQEEAWCDTGRPEAPLLYKFILRRGGDVVGVIYFDLFARAHKFSGAAHFNVQSGCTNTVAGANDLARGSSLDDPHVRYASRQTPIVVIAMSMHHPGSSIGHEEKKGTTTTTTTVVVTITTITTPTITPISHETHIEWESDQAQQQMCVSYEDLQTVYHEFGHALHSVLSETHYQHLAGTRGPVDLAEVGCAVLCCAVLCCAMLCCGVV
jgi:intermediate peptidase